MKGIRVLRLDRRDHLPASPHRVVEGSFGLVDSVKLLQAI
jgi:hypothetical protein